MGFVSNCCSKIDNEETISVLSTEILKMLFDTRFAWITALDIPNAATLIPGPRA
jgi:hypothetical protein